MVRELSMAASLCSCPVFLPPASTCSVARSPLLPVVSQSAIDAAQASPAATRRALLTILTASLPFTTLLAKDARAVSSIKIEGPPPPSGGLPGTENADEARDTTLPLKNRFFLQPLPPSEAAARAKESAQDIVAVKALIDKKAWPFVQNDLRLKASYLRFDLNTVISSKSKEEKKALKSLTAKLFDDISNLDYAAKSKSVSQAEKYYAATVSSLNDVLAKIG